MMADTRWRLSTASTSQLLELLWQIWDLLNRKFRFFEGPIRCRHTCQWRRNKCCFHSHSLQEEENHACGGPHICFIHDFDGYQYL